MSKLDKADKFTDEKINKLFAFQDFLRNTSTHSIKPPTITAAVGRIVRNRSQATIPKKVNSSHMLEGAEKRQRSPCLGQKLSSKYTITTSLHPTIKIRTLPTPGAIL